MAGLHGSAQSRASAGRPRCTALHRGVDNSDQIDCRPVPFCRSNEATRWRARRMGILVAKDVKVVVRYLDGRVRKGTTLNFDPCKRSFLLSSMEPDECDEPVRVCLTDLKAVFFVKDFGGNPEYSEEKEFLRPLTGRKLKVQFADGETLVGVSLSYDETRDGFFLFPADPASNNERVFVVQRSVIDVRRA